MKHEAQKKRAARLARRLRLSAAVKAYAERGPGRVFFATVCDGERRAECEAAAREVQALYNAADRIRAEAF